MKGRTMPRNSTKSALQRPLSEVCSDCGAPDANWASINRAVLMCNDCASVHMGLGRHISQVKHLQKSHWHPNLLSMVQHLVNAGANAIWEHSLLDPAQMRSGKRKPNPSDHIHPTKADFIKSKYLNLSYVHRLPTKEEEYHDISKQLHSSVRTGNLETSLRLLSLGAHADFFSTEKGNTPLHIAAKYGQALQVELLVAYGADPGVRDSNGRTAEDLARADNHNDLGDRLVELYYEVSDRFISYVCGEMPDHKAGKHYLLPKLKDANVVTPEGKKRLHGLSNQAFGVLAMDVYDEVERRELERIWQDIQKSVLIPGKGTNPALQTEVVPFLPLHPDYSSTRNQGRQKLAHFKDSELHNLITDVIHEITHREKVFGPIAPSVRDEDPIYDVPPDEEDQELNVASIERSAVIEPPKETVPKEQFLAVKSLVEEKETEILKLKEQNRELSDKATKLARENIDLNRKIKVLTDGGKTIPHIPLLQSSFVPHPRLQSPGARPNSVYNPNDSSGSQSSLHSMESSEHRRNTIHIDHRGANDTEDSQTAASGTPEKPDTKSSESPSHCSIGSEYDNNSVSKDETGAGKDEKSKSSTKKSDAAQNNSNANNNLSQCSPPTGVQSESDPAVEEPANKDSEEPQEKAPQSDTSSPNSQVDTTECDLLWPEPSALMKKTELLTKMIQTLLRNAQLKKVESYLECAEKILSAVTDVIALFEKPHMTAIKSVLQQICESAHKLRDRCKETPEQKPKVDSHKQLTEEIIAYAYAVAKAEKQLVMMAPKQNQKPQLPPMETAE